MSEPQDIPARPTRSPATASPISSPGRHHFLIPSPIPTRRNRTLSQSEKAAEGPSYRGKMHNFCREKGHGFVMSEDNGEKLFVHISDIEGDIIPKEGDEVTFKKCLIPPKYEKYSAVHVRIAHMTGAPHETWDSPVHRGDESPHS